MSDPAVPARAGAGPPAVTTAEPRKLDDVLLAMDVVDTLRHRDRVVDQELNAEAREEQLVARLKEIYGAQGIDVPERILKDGVKALDEQRFVYKPPPPSLGVSLAKIYITRRRWAPAATVLAVVLVVGGGVGWFAQESSAAGWRNMPAEITRLSTEDQALAIDPQVDAQIQGIERTGLAAVAGNDRDGAKAQVALLKDMKDRLSTEYDLRVPYKWDEDTGVWRIPRTNPNGRNYYLIVEAVRPGGGTVEVPVRDEETNKIERVSKWGQRVSKETFDKFKDEKSTSGIIQNDILGHKARGELEPKYDVPTPGGAITKW